MSLLKKGINRVFKTFHKYRYHRIEQFMNQPSLVQKRVFQNLISQATNTDWGRQYAYRSIKNLDIFTERVPVHNYDELKPWFSRMMHGEKDVLWPGQVQWFSKSSGTTADRSKYLPVSSQLLKHCLLRGTWDTMTLFYRNRQDARQFECKSMLMGGSLESFSAYPKTMIGDVSAIMIEHMPYIGRPFFIPDIQTALLPDWEEKLEKLAQAGLKEPKVVMIGGVPTWTLMLFRRMLEISGKNHMLEIWPEFQVYTHGGVGFKPYREQFQRLFPSPDISYQEIYNASEGYFSVQDDLNRDDMLLLLNNGIFYEFIPVEDWESDSPRTLPIWEVELHKQYALVISTCAGLWRYQLGDTVRFTSIRPYRIKVTGRVQQFINAFGEEVMVENTDRALAQACSKTGTIVKDYTVAPIYFQEGHRGGHEWLIEFEQPPVELTSFAALLDQELQKINSDYAAKRYRDIALNSLSVRSLPKGTFAQWMRARGKFGGQHKVPRLANHREYLEEIKEFVGSPT